LFGGQAALFLLSFKGFFYIISRYWIHYLIFYVIGSINWYYINYFIWSTIFKKYRYIKKGENKIEDPTKTIKIPQFIIFLISLYIFIFLFFFQSALYKITNRLLSIILITIRLFDQFYSTGIPSRSHINGKQKEVVE